MAPHRRSQRGRLFERPPVLAAPVRARLEPQVDQAGQGVDEIERRPPRFVGRGPQAVDRAQPRLLEPGQGGREHERAGAQRVAVRGHEEVAEEAGEGVEIALPVFEPERQRIVGRPPVPEVGHRLRAVKAFLAVPEGVAAQPGVAAARQDRGQLVVVGGSEHQVDAGEHVVAEDHAPVGCRHAVVVGEEDAGASAARPGRPERHLAAASPCLHFVEVILDGGV
jgi:hypothetical protein